MPEETRAVPNGALIKSLRGHLSAQQLAAKISEVREAGSVWPAISAQTIYNTERTRGAVRITTLMALAAGLGVDWKYLCQVDGLEKTTNAQIAGKWRGFLVELASADDSLELADVMVRFSQAGATINLDECLIEDGFSAYRDVCVDGCIVHDIALITSFPVGPHWQQPHGLTHWMLRIESPHLMIGRLNYVAQHNTDVAMGRIILVREDSELFVELLEAAEFSLQEDPIFPRSLKHPRRDLPQLTKRSK